MLMNNRKTTFSDRGTHIEVVTYESGHRHQFLIVKNKLQPGKDGRLYGHHRDLTLAVDIDKTPTHYTLLKRRAAQELILPEGSTNHERLNDDGTTGRPDRTVLTEEEKKQREKARKEIRDSYQRRK